MDARSSLAFQRVKKRDVPKKLSAQHLTCVERLQAVSGVVKSVDDILNEIFPYQSTYRRAGRLVTPPSRLDSVTRGTPSVGVVSRGATRRKRLASSPVLQSIEKNVLPSSVPDIPLPAKIRECSPTQLGVREQDQHTLALWEDKFRGRRLSPQDILFLLTHEDVLSVLENTNMLRETRLTYDQLMELEMALESLHKDRSTITSHVCLCKILCTNVWVRGITFKLLPTERNAIVRESSPQKIRLAPLSPSPPAEHQVMKRASSSAVLQTRQKLRSPDRMRLQTALPENFRSSQQKETLAIRREESQHQADLHEEQHRQICK
ncbi:hypothetical protein FI667_g6951, partial [Globisporangium splendens]